MKCILLATDLSDRSDIALERAVLIARRFSARLHVVHVVDAEWPVTIGEALRERAMDYLEDQLEVLRGAGPVEAEVSAIFGTPGDDIGAIARDVGADLIVSGRHRHGGSAERFTGTTVERVTRTAPVPILVVGRTSEDYYVRAVVGIDFSECAAHALSIATELLGRDNVVPAHAYRLRTTNPSLRAGARRGRAALDKQKTERFVLEEIEDWIANQGSSLEARDVVIREGSPADVLSGIAYEMNCDLICVGAHGRSWLSSLILGSTVNAMLHRSDHDLLIAPLLPGSSKRMTGAAATGAAATASKPAG